MIKKMLFLDVEVQQQQQQLRVPAGSPCLCGASQPQNVHIRLMRYSELLPV